MPGVQSAALQNITPLTFSGWNTLIENPPGFRWRRSAAGERQRRQPRLVFDAGHFARRWARLRRGRQKGAPHAIVVNETLVKKSLWRG